VTELVDYSYARPSPQSIVDAGYVAVMRYLGNDSRCITPGERDALLNAGLGIGLIWETEADRVLGGGPAGDADARAANGYADQLGAPGWVPIYYCTDFHASSSQINGVICDYYRAACNVGGRFVRVYGGAPVIDHMHTKLGCQAGWQAAAASWSDYRTSPHAAMHQQVEFVLNNTCDANTVLCDDSAIDWLWGYEGGGIPVTPDELRQIVREECTNSINAALSLMYTGSRIVQVPGDPAVYELCWQSGERCRRHITTPDEVHMLQYTDQVAGKPGDGPRMITDPVQIEAFKRLRLIGSAADQDAEFGTYSAQDEDAEVD
jgi:hypothetical protein